MDPLEREKKVLNTLGSYTEVESHVQGGKITLGGWSSSVSTGKRLREKGKPIRSCRNSVKLETGMWAARAEAVPVPRFLMIPHRLNVTFAGMASVAWTVGSYLDLAPVDKEAANYDLLCILTLWSEKFTPKRVTEMVESVTFSSLTAGGVPGRQVIWQLIEDGSIKHARQHYGEVGGTLTGLVFAEIIEAIGGALWQEFKHEAFGALADGWVPIASRFNGVARTLGRIDSFYETAVAYYRGRLNAATSS